jgi:hypothetical protein
LTSIGATGPTGKEAKPIHLEVYMSASQKVVVVTGASQNIGAELVKAFRSSTTALSQRHEPSGRRMILTFSRWRAISPTRPPPAA